MDEILALQQQLAAVQQSSTTQRLSDRNCVELVMKLQSLKLVDLIFTRSGKEYLTPSQLVLEIRDEVLTRGGRVNLTDLPDSLNVTLSHIEAALPDVLADPSVRVIRGELITDYYLSSLLDEVNDSLAASETGTDTLADMATRYGLPVDVVRTTIESNSSQLHSTFDPDTMTLTSDSAFQRQRAQARGLLRGLTSPTTISEAAEMHGLPTGVVTSAVHDMMESGCLAGVLKGRGPRAVYTPAVYTDAVADTLSADFSTSGFLSRDTLTRLHISDVEGFVQNHLSQGILLSKCVVSGIWVATLSTSAADAIASESWIDVISTLPPGFPEEDTPRIVGLIAEAISKNHPERENVNTEDKSGDKLLEGTVRAKAARARRKGRRKDSALEEEEVNKQQSAGVAFGERYFVSPMIQSNVTRVVDAEADKRARERACMISERMETVGLTTEVVRGGPDDNDTREPPVSHKKGKGKGRRRAGGKDRDNAQTHDSNEAGGTHDGVDKFAAVSVPTLTEMVEIAMADEVIAKFSDNDYSESGADGEDMIAKVIEQTYGETGLSDLFHKSAADAVVELERERVVAKLNSEKRLLGELSALEVYMRSTRLLDQELAALSIQYLLDNHSISVVCRVLEMVCKNCGIAGIDTEEVMKHVQRNERLEKLREMASRLPRALEPRAIELIRTVAPRDCDENSIEEVLNAYDGVTPIFDLPQRRPVDKKSERAMCANLREQMVESLNAAVSVKPPADMDVFARQTLLKVLSILTYAKLRSGVMMDFAAVDAEKFAVFIEGLAQTGNDEAIGDSLAAVRLAALGTRAPNADHGPSEWDVVLQKVGYLQETVA